MNLDQQSPNPKPPIDIDSLRIASPCSADWASMQGDEKRRFCGECSLHVHDLSAMTRDEVLDFLGEQSGRTCVRMHRRADGKVLTQDCPVGWAKVRAKARAARRAVAMFAATLFGAVAACGLRPLSEGSGSGSESPGSNQTETPPPPEMGEPLMGDVAIPEGHLVGRLILDSDPECEFETGELIAEPERRD